MGLLPPDAGASSLEPGSVAPSLPGLTFESGLGAQRSPLAAAPTPPISFEVIYEDLKRPITALSLSEEEERDLVTDVLAAIAATDDSRKERLATVQKVRDRYYLATPNRTPPFEEGANWHIPFTRWVLDAVHARLWGNSFGTPNWVMVTGVKGAADVDLAARTEPFLQYVNAQELELPRLYDDALERALTDGFVMVKVPWERRVRRVRRRRLQTEQIEITDPETNLPLLTDGDVPALKLIHRYVVDERDEEVSHGPKAQLVTIDNFIAPNPNVSRVTDQPWVAQQFWLTRDQLWMDRERQATLDGSAETVGLYRHVEEIITVSRRADTNPAGTESHMAAQEGASQAVTTPDLVGEVRCYEILWPYRAWKMARYPGVRGDELPDRAVLTIAADEAKLLRGIHYPFWDPYPENYWVKVELIGKEGRWYSQALGEIIMSVQDELDTIHWQRCPRVGTKILTADLRWVNAEDLCVGDEVVGFEAEATGRGGPRKLQPSRVEATGISEDECITVRTTRGEVTVNTIHPFLIMVPGMGLRWKRARDLKLGDEIKFLARPWLEDKSDSWLSGIADGEGSLTQESGAGGLRVAAAYQSRKNPAILERVTEELQQQGFVPKRSVSHSRFKPGGDGVDVIHVNGIARALRFIGTFRPLRFLAKWRDYLSNGLGFPKASWAVVEAVAPAGRQPIVNLQTSTRTYIAEGFACHNTDATTVMILAFFTFLAEEGAADTLEKIKLGQRNVVESLDGVKLLADLIKISLQAPGLDVEQLVLKFGELLSAIAEPQLGSPTRGDKTAFEIGTIVREGNLKFTKMIAKLAESIVAVCKIVLRRYAQFYPLVAPKIYRVTGGDDPIREMSLDDLNIEPDLMLRGQSVAANREIEAAKALRVLQMAESSTYLRIALLGNPDGVYELLRTFLQQVDWPGGAEVLLGAKSKAVATLRAGLQAMSMMMGLGGPGTTMQGNGQGGPNLAALKPLMDLLNKSGLATELAALGQQATGGGVSQTGS